VSLQPVVGARPQTSARVQRSGSPWAASASPPVHAQSPALAMGGKRPASLLAGPEGVGLPLLNLLPGGMPSVWHPLY